ncbi:MAG: hypothetical protein [Circular genetic element sp.]|nr:MAG: hypothetical protein [Circular genetic element sp.]
MCVEQMSPQNTHVCFRALYSNFQFVRHSTNSQIAPQANSQQTTQSRKIMISATFGRASTRSLCGLHRSRIGDQPARVGNNRTNRHSLGFSSGVAGCPSCNTTTPPPLFNYILHPRRFPARALNNLIIQSDPR